MPNFRVVDNLHRANLSPRGYRAIVDRIIIDAGGHSTYKSAAPTGGSGRTKPDLLQNHASAVGALVLREPPPGGVAEVGGNTAIIPNEPDAFDGVKSKVVVPFPADPIPIDELAYLDQYLTLLVSELDVAGGIKVVGGHYAFNPNGGGVVDVRKMLFGMMMLTKCR